MASTTARKVNDFSMLITNKVVWDFYQKHPNLDIETTNVMLVDILNKIMQSTHDSISTSVSKQILDDIRTIKDQITVFKTDVSTSFSVKFDEYKMTYMDNLKTLFATNMHLTLDKISPIMDRFSDTFQDKMRLLIFDTISKNQESLSKSELNITRDIMLQVKHIQDAVSFDTQKLLSTTANSDSISAFIFTIDEKFTKMLVNSQNLFSVALASTESRLATTIVSNNTRIDQIRNESNANMTLQKNVNTSIEELLRKMENSSIKGKISENLLTGVIERLFPIAEINCVGGIKESGDLILVRVNKPKILFENKNYEANVNKSEIDKFYRDIDVQECSAIMLSQKSGITNKNNFEIEVYKGNVVIFVHNTQYDADRIKTAVDIIDHLHSKLVEIKEKSGDSTVFDMDIETMASINTEYNAFIASKNNILKMFKENNQRMIAQIESFSIPSLDIILKKRYSSMIVDREDTFICQYCSYMAKNTRSLTAHYRGCKQKNSERNSGIDDITLDGNDSR